MTKIKPHPDLTANVAAGMAKEVETRLDQARQLIRQHPGENGRSLENIIAEYFTRIVPDEYGVGTGFVVDVHNKMSRQQDVVIFKKNYYPRFVVGGVSFFMVESVAATIEVKAKVADIKTLQGAFANLESVKALDRTGGGENYIPRTCFCPELTVKLKEAGQLQKDDHIKVDPEIHENQIFTALVAVEAVSPETFIDEFMQYFGSKPRSTWPNGYAVLKHGTSLNYRSPNSGLVCNPMTATSLGLSAVDEIQNTLPLLDLTESLISFLRVLPLIDFQPLKYFYANRNLMPQIVSRTLD